MKKTVRIFLIVISALTAAAILVVTLYLSPFLFRAPVTESHWENQELSGTDFDVIVIGTEPEGIAAAVSAARNGMNTLLLGGDSVPGGLMTLGQLNYIDMCHGRDGTLLTRGIFEEFYASVGGNAFNIAEAVNFFIDIIASEPLLTMRTQSQLVAPVMENGRINGVRMLENGSETVFSGKRFIDATADGDLAALAGVPYTFGGEDIGEKDRKMGVTLVFELSGVNWTRVFFHLNAQRLLGLFAGNNILTGATNKIAWGYEDEGLSYISKDPMVRFRGPNMARQRQGTVLINALVVYDVDPLDPASYNDAIGRANAELTYIVPFMRENFIGFRNAELVSTASKLYVRESRHFVGEYQLTIDDLLENRDQWDKIAIGGYPADVQASILQPYGTVIGYPDRYAVPFRSLVPLGVDNLLIVGRSASFTSQAASSARVIPLGMACGQAAGAAAAQSIREDIDFRPLSRDQDAIQRLQSTLRAQGAFLEDFYIPEPIMSHWAYDGLATLRRIGLMAGGYENDYQLDGQMNIWSYKNLLNGVVNKAGLDFSFIDIGSSLTNSSVIEQVTSIVIYSGIISGIDSAYYSSSSVSSHAGNLEFLSGAGLLDARLADLFADGDRVPNTAEVVMLLANLYDFII